VPLCRRRPRAAPPLCAAAAADVPSLLQLSSCCRLCRACGGAQLGCQVLILLAQPLSHALQLSMGGLKRQHLAPRGACAGWVGRRMQQGMLED